MGRLWGLGDESREEIGRHLSILQFERTPVAVAPSPPRIVAGRDGNVSVAKCLEWPFEIPIRPLKLE